MSLPILYGSVALYLGKKADEFQTHEWTLYVRGPNHEDLSVAISKVVFQLHPSFPQPIRELSQPPFEVTERGWGEFEAQIRIHWKDPTEKPTIVNHGIKLYPPGTPPNVLPNSDVSPEPVVAETYDEVVFTDPNESFYRLLTRISVVPKTTEGCCSTYSALREKSYNDDEDFLALIGAQKFLQEELVKVKEHFRVVSEELEVVDQTLIAAQQQQQREAAAAASSTSTSSSKRRSSSNTSRGKARPQSQSKKSKTSGN